MQESHLYVNTFTLLHFDFFRACMKETVSAYVTYLYLNKIRAPDRLSVFKMKTKPVWVQKLLRLYKDFVCSHFPLLSPQLCMNQREVRRWKTEGSMLWVSGLNKLCYGINITCTWTCMDLCLLSLCSLCSGCFSFWRCEESLWRQSPHRPPCRVHRVLDGWLNRP